MAFWNPVRARAWAGFCRYGGACGGPSIALPPATLSGHSPAVQQTSETHGQALKAAIARFESGERVGAIEACRALVETVPQARPTLALMLLRAGHLTEGVEALDSLLDEHPDNAALLAHRGTAHLHLGTMEAARADLERAVAIDPHQGEAWLSLAGLHRRAGDMTTMLAVLEQAAKALPGHPGIAANRATAIAEHGDAAEAVALLEPLVAAAPERATLAFNLGTALRRLGRLDEAEHHLGRAVEIDPGYAPAWHNLGNTRIDRGDVEGGFAAYRQAHTLRRKPGGPMRDEHSFVATSATKLAHDIEQLSWLREQALLGPEWDARITAYRLTLETLPSAQDDTHMVALPPAAAPIRNVYNRLVHADPGARIDGPAVSPGFDGAAAEEMYRDNVPGIAWGDGLLTPEALAALRHFCLASTIWYEFRYDNGYLGAFQEEGFDCPLLLQIAQELRAAMPGIVGPHSLRKTWAFKYDSRLSGIRMHADAAAVNVNFWLTPDEANLDAQGGGLVVWDKEAPMSWDFARYNRDTPAVRAHLEEVGAKSVIVPHRQNRAVLFNSDLFHETGAFDFRPGYENRRINVTMLFGRRGD